MMKVSPLLNVRLHTSQALVDGECVQIHFQPSFATLDALAVDGGIPSGKDPSIPFGSWRLRSGARIWHRLARTG